MTMRKESINMGTSGKMDMRKALLLLVFGLLFIPFASAQFIDSFTQIRKAGEFSINTTTLNIMTSNVSRLYITQSGLIGIGTVPTNYNLTVLGSVNITSDVIIGGALNFTGTEKNATFQGDVRIIGTLYGGSPLKIAGGLNLLGGNITIPSGSSIVFADGSQQYSAGGNGGPSQWNSTGLRMYLNDTSSLVGIGTTRPTKKLSVNGTLDAITFDPSASTPTINTTGNNLTLSSSTGSVIIKLG
jgi:hypothetical protein